MQISINRFAGRVALVTGCGSKTGIGYATARLLFAGGARVAITSTTERINKRQETIDPSGHRVQAYVADLTDRPQVENLIEHVMAYFGRIDILVNNAGMAQVGDAQGLPEVSEDRKRQRRHR
jgi:3-oxoacyl-[acyl-carrier protein] reductase